MYSAPKNLLYQQGNFSALIFPKEVYERSKKFLNGKKANTFGQTIT